MVICCSCANVQAQDTSSVELQNSEAPKSKNETRAGEPIQIGNRFKIKSKILDQDREYLVYLPASYHNDRYLQSSYPVLFLLDGELFFHPASGMVDYMGGLGGQIPELIVVGVRHENRTHELTPTKSIHDFRKGKTSPTLSESGGGEKFLQFVTQELMPRIDSDYRTRPFRILFGHSFGGLLAAHAFLKNQNEFQAFILADPSLWWDERIVLKQLEQTISGGKSERLRCAMFVSRVPTYVSPDNKQTQQGFENISESIEGFGQLLQNVKSVRYQLQNFEQRTHTSVPIQTLYNGLLHAFEGYEPRPELFLSPPEKMKQHFRKVSKTVGLELLPREQLIDMWGNSFLNYDEEFSQFAIPLFRLNTENYPDSSASHVSLAEAYAKSGEYHKSRIEFERALQLDPDNAAAKSGLDELSKQPQQPGRRN